MRYRGSRQSLLVALLALLFLLPAPAAAPAATGEDTLCAVGGRVMCQCGCGLVLANCPHRNCGWGVPAKEFIDGHLASGRSGDELVEYYVAQYGEQIPGSPPKSGVNLPACIT